MSVAVALIVLLPAYSFAEREVLSRDVTASTFSLAGNIRKGASSEGERHGQFVWVLKECGYYDLAREFRAASIRWFGEAEVRKGEASMSGFDYYSGNCARAKRAAENALRGEIREKIFDPPASVEVTSYSGVYSFDGSTFLGGYVFRGDKVLLLERKSNRCRIRTPDTDGWVNCDRVYLGD